MALSGSYFDVLLIGTGAVLAGGFASVSGLDMEADYEIYTEGGSNYPRYFFKNVKPQHLVLECAHPSPLSAFNGFFGCKHFSRCNAFLECNGIEPIDWDLNHE